MTPDSGPNAVTSSASTRLPCTRCSRTTLALSSGRVTRTCWAGAAGTASNASAVTVSMHGGRIAPSRWTGKLTHGDRNGRRPLAVDRDIKTIKPGVRKGNVEHEDRAGLDLRDPRRRLGEVDVAVASQDLDVLLVEQADLHLVLAHLGALALEAEHQVQARVHRGKLLHPDVLEDPQDGELAGLVHQGVVGDDGEVEMHEALSVIRHPSSVTTDNGQRTTDDDHFLENGIDARVRSHSSANTPPPFPLGSDRKSVV